MTYDQALISAQERIQWITIATHHLTKRLAFGKPVSGIPAKLLRENEIVEDDSRDAITYTRADLSNDLARVALHVSAEAVSMSSFLVFGRHRGFIDLLDSSFKDRKTRPESQPIDAIAQRVPAEPRDHGLRQESPEE